ncbi:MAG: four helix bundle protein [Bacteroidetes bacterium]|nr:four helix bundle protein [Bacteroidota bacterium]
MFDFEKLDLYKILKDQTIKVLSFIESSPGLDKYIADQWKRANLSIYLNLAEGTGRMTEADKQHFLTISRGSAFESVAILNLLKDMQKIDDQTFTDMYNAYESISKMLLGMYRSYSKNTYKP